MVNLNPFGRSKGDISVIESVGDPIEADFKVRNGSDALQQLPEEAGVTELLDPGRPSVVKPS